MHIRDTIQQRARMLAPFPGQQTPAFTPALLERARAVAAGNVFFYQRTPVRVGLRGIDWTGGQIQHQEWRAQLNRFHELGGLATALRETGEECFARAARDFIEDWIDFNTPFLDRSELNPGDNTLNLSIRVGSGKHGGWGAALPVLLLSPVFDDGFLEKVLASVAQQARFLAGHLAPRGNWRVSHLDCLVFTALRFPFLDGAGELLAAGLRGMREALATQFLPDGVHVERTPGYAAWMTWVLANYLRLGSIFPEAAIALDRERFRHAVEYLAHSRLCGFNDSTAPHRDPEDDPLREPSRLLAFAGMEREAKTPMPRERVFEHAGQVFARAAWQAGAEYLAFDASTWGGGHSHLSRLGFSFRAGGRLLIADPGILNYEMSDPLAAYGKSTRAHSTVCVDGFNQSGADASLHRAWSGSGVCLLHASYQGGYWPNRFGWNFPEGRGLGVYARHERVLLWVRGEYLLVLDFVDEAGAHAVHGCWQLGPMQAWTMQEEERAWWSRNPDTNLLIKLLAPADGVECDCMEGREQPPRGWVGEHGNDHVAAPHVEFRLPTPAPDAVLATLACAFAGDEPPAYGASELRRTHQGQLLHLEITRPDRGRDLVSWSRLLEPPLDDGEPFQTDAPLVWLRLDAAGAPGRGFALDCSHLCYQGRELFDHGADRRAREFSSPLAPGAGMRTPDSRPL